MVGPAAGSRRRSRAARRDVLTIAEQAATVTASSRPIAHARDPTRSRLATRATPRPQPIASSADPSATPGLTISRVFFKCSKPLGRHHPARAFSGSPFTGSAATRVFAWLEARDAPTCGRVIRAGQVCAVHSARSCHGGRGLDRRRATAHLFRACTDVGAERISVAHRSSLVRHAWCRVGILLVHPEVRDPQRFVLEQRALSYWILVQ
jgi:hypothetical protein